MKTNGLLLLRNFYLLVTERTNHIVILGNLLLGERKPRIAIRTEQFNVLGLLLGVHKLL